MTGYRSLLEALAGSEIEFIVVGGVAATVHGSARLTQDLGVVYARTPDNLQRLVDGIASHKPYVRGAPPDLPFSWDVETVTAGVNFTLTTKIGDLDLFGEIAGGGNYEDLFPHTVEITVFGCTIRCLDLPTLIRVKRAAGRPKDLEAVAELEALLEEGG